jgi:predicted enzyme related to lactoylglutathione lyase
MPTTKQHGDAPPHGLPYFTVSSRDGAGAIDKVLAGPFDIGAGRIAAAQDLRGAAFALFESETGD